MSEENRTNQTQQLFPLLKKAIHHLVTHNFWLKAISVVISIALWAGLISQDETLTREKTFNNVNVNVTGTELMKSNAYIVTSNLDDVLKGVSIVAEVPQQQYETAEASAYNVRVDLSRINGTGEQELKLLSTNSSTFGKVVSTTPASVTVNVEDYIVRQRIPVSATINGTIPDGWYMSQPTVDPSLVAVSGPDSIVKTISRARTFINTADIEWTEGTIVTSSDIKLFNRSGDEVNSSLLNTTSSGLQIDSVIVEYTLLPTMSFDTFELVQVGGTVAKGYELKEIKVSPESITVAARQEVLDQLTELPMERTVSVKGLKETTVFQLKVQKPSDDAIISNDTVTVTAVIEPVEVQD